MEYFQATFRFNYNAHLLFAGFTKNHFGFHLADTNPKDGNFSLTLPSLDSVFFLRKSYANYRKNDPEYADGYVQVIKNGYAMQFAGIKEAFRLEPHKTFSPKTLSGRMESNVSQIKGVNGVNGDFDMTHVRRITDRLERLNAALRTH